jgi:transcriptional regulator with XRE-family HTH domain
MHSQLASNLRYLASSSGSISEFCRAVDINRQQFNKYLNGRSLPSPRNLRRICDHTGVSESDLFLPTAEFAARWSAPRSQGDDSALFSFIEAAQKSSSEVMKKYEGLYFKYYYSLSKPGLVRKSLLSVAISERGAVTKSVEPAGRDLTRLGIAGLCKYSGEAIFLGDRLFLLEFEYLSRKEITYSVYFPSYMNGSFTLPGLMLGVSAGNRHDPAASRILLVRITGPKNLREAMRSCGLFDPDSAEIDPHIRDLIDNGGTAADALFLPRTIEHMKPSLRNVLKKSGRMLSKGSLNAPLGQRRETRSAK